MSDQNPLCSVSGCFMNDNGTHCKLLSEAPKHLCPFFKTQAEVDKGREAAHDRLVNAWRWDLIRKYEWNTSKERAW